MKYPLISCLRKFTYILRSKQKRQNRNYSKLPSNQNPEIFAFRIKQIFSAIVPIVKLTEIYSNIKMDIAVQTKCVVNGVRLLNAYLDMDDRLRILMSVIMKWVHNRRIHGTRHGFINSYGYLLMFIKYCQTRMPVPLLPLLHMYTELNGKCWIQSPVEFYGLQEQNASHSLMEILIGFFRMYAHFKYDCIEIDITTEHFKDRCDMKFVNKKKFLCGMAIVDPVFNQQNVTRSFYFRNQMCVKKEFLRAYECCKYGKIDELLQFRLE